jgi:hypothetical protein
LAKTLALHCGQLNNDASDAMEDRVAQAADLPGAAHLELVDGVVHLDPQSALLEAMLAGWVRQQQTRFLKEEATIRPRIALVRRFVVHQCLPVAVEASRRRGIHCPAALI